MPPPSIHILEAQLSALNGVSEQADGNAVVMWCCEANGLTYSRLCDEIEVTAEKTHAHTDRGYFQAKEYEFQSQVGTGSKGQSK